MYENDTSDLRVATRETPRVQVHLEIVQNFAAQLDKVLSQLEDRLGPVLGPDLRAEKRGADSDPRPSQSELANELNNLGEKLSYFCVRGHDLLERLEV